MWWILCAAWARSVAVLPFDAGAKSETYDGLGRALAGMVVSDLSKAPELQLVERDRLDALLAEIDLGKTGFVEASTARELAKGVGAEWVVLGTFTVVNGAFLMDGRAVDVNSGKILTAVDVQGTVEDFVTVEKQLVEELLDGLKVVLSAGARRQILADAPTEDFGAVASYGAGLQAEFAGQIEEARKKFEEAAQRDPAFDLPQQRIAALRLKLEALEVERRANQVDQRTRELMDALAKTPTEMDQKGPTRSDRERALYALRFGLLGALKRRCELAAELAHYYTRHKGVLGDDAEHPGPRNETFRVAHEIGLVGEPYMWDHGLLHLPRGDHDELVSMGLPTLSYPGGLLVRTVDGPDAADRLGDSLINEAIACAGPDAGARVAAVEEVIALATRFGALDQPMGWTSGEGGKLRPTGNVGIELEVMRLGALAQRDGMSAEVSAGLARLLDRELAPDEAYAVRSDVAKITALAEGRARRVAALDGLTPDQVLELQRAWAAGDSSRIRSDGQCAHFHVNLGTPKEQLTRLESKYAGGPPSADAWSHVMSAASSLQVPRVMGCLVGHPGVVASLPEAVAWIESARLRFREGRDVQACDAALAEVEKQAKQYGALPDVQPGLYTFVLVQQTLAKLVQPGCMTVK